MDQDQFEVDITKGMMVSAATWAVPFAIVFLGAILRLNYVLQFGGLLIIVRALHYYYTEL